MHQTKKLQFPLTRTKAILCRFQSSIVFVLKIFHQNLLVTNLQPANPSIKGVQVKSSDRANHSITGSETSSLYLQILQRFKEAQILQSADL